MEPIYLIDWKSNFFQELYQYLHAEFPLNNEKVILIFPHRRPCTYFTELYKKEKKIQFAPKTMTKEDFFLLCSLGWLQEYNEEINELESIQALYSIVKNLEKKSQKKNVYTKITQPFYLKKDFKQELLEFTHFYPYGQALMQLIHECFENNTLAFNIPHTDDKVEAFMAYIFENLREITFEYKEYLEKNKKTNSSFQSYKITEFMHLEEKIPKLFEDKILIFAGFNRLTPCEEHIFSYFYQNKAKFIIYSDPTLAIESNKAHYSTYHHQTWVQKWNTNFKVLKNSSFLQAPQYFFHQAYDQHSQLQNFDKKTLNNESLIVLNDYQLLMPLLYTLAPEFEGENINISMGYPIQQSLVFQFLESIIGLKLSSKILHTEDLLLHTPELLVFIKQKLLQYIIHGEELEIVENALYENNLPYYSLKELKNMSSIFHDYFITSIAQWFEIENIAQLIECVEKYFNDFYTKIPEKNKEKLVLLRLKQVILEEFQGNLFKSEKYGFDFCIKLLHETLLKQRISFKNHNINTLQVLGFLETRLLQFDTIHIFDANSEYLPANVPINPFIPHSFRPILGLPSNKEIELASAFNWYSLCAGAKNLHIYWQESHGTGIFDSKKSPSPLVKDLIWQYEKIHNQLLKPDALSYTQAQCLVGSQLFIQEQEINATLDIQNKVNALFAKGIPFTLLDTYFQCPAKFFYSNLCDLNLQKISTESEDSSKLGILVHSFFEELYQDNKIYFINELEKKVHALIEKHLKNSELKRILPAESFLLLTHSFPYRIKEYLKNQPFTTEVVGREINLNTLIHLNNQQFTLFGKIDRIDKRENKNLILDYKTGSVDNKIFSESFWDSPLYYDIAFSLNQLKPDFSLQKALFKFSQSLQLPFYMLLAKKNFFPSNAGFIQLKDKGKEKFLFNESFTINEEIFEKFHVLLQFILLNASKNHVFSKNIEKHCLWCSFQKYCM